MAPGRVIEKVVDDCRGKHLNTLAWLVRPSAVSFTTNTAVELHSLWKPPPKVDVYEINAMLNANARQNPRRTQKVKVSVINNGQ